VSGPRDVEVARAKAALAEAREQLAAAIVGMREDVVESADWREWVRERPLASVAAAFLLGVALGGRT
jgi:hypothetical protein